MGTMIFFVQDITSTKSTRWGC